MIVVVARKSWLLPFDGHQQKKLPNWICVLRKYTACTSIALPGVERGSSNRAPMIMFNPYMTQFNCSHHGILIREKITIYLYAKGKSK